ncbi:MAG TPA: ATP-binding protein [Verrucomicrobiae bacterium]|jgi:signal transduction histidine kinase
MNGDLKPNSGNGGTVQKLTRLLAAPVIEPSQRAARIQAVERDIVLPLRLLIIAILGYYFFFSHWLDKPTEAAFVDHVQQGASDATKDWGLHNAGVLKGSFIIYAALNLAVGAIFILKRQLALAKIEWLVFAAGTLDCVLMGTLTFLSSGYASGFYFVFVVLILHNAMAIPVAFPQLLLNFLSIASFVSAGFLDKLINLPATIMNVEEISQEQPYERIGVLVVWALCCYGIQMLFEKQKRAEAEATEFAVRQERLHTAGRLAAEIAHQIKNPLGIITNAAFCLNRAVHEGETAVEEQIQIIREEVDRADQIITELMGYAQLAEGTVERLEVAEELDAAVQEVFPAAAKYQVAIQKNYAPALPALLMQRRHLSGVLVNLLQNAREAMHGQGAISIMAEYGDNDSVRILIADTGPGIPQNKIDKIFDAYFTTRDKGTGLGLAIVKHNTEMYGGAVQVESEVGKGTRFVLEFPARILMRLSK